MASWTLDFAAEAIDTTNFSSGGYKENIEGLKDAKITATGPFDSTAMALTSGAAATLILGASATVTYTVTSRITNIKLITDVTKAVMVEVTAVSNGSFTPSIA